MSMQVISPRGVGFLLVNSHPAGCAKTVTDMCAEIGQVRVPAGRRPVAVVVGSSAGYGLACALSGILRHGIDGVGVGFEQPPSERRTATAGWYRTAALAQVAADCGTDFSFLNADAFDDATKDTVADLIAKRFGGVDYLIYSVAAPRRLDPRSGETYRSVIKPIGTTYHAKTLQLRRDGSVAIGEVSVDGATPDEIAETIKVMGGDDWARWVEAFEAGGLLRNGFTTVALSYIGSQLTAQIYRNGSIGAAKADLEATADQITERYAKHGARGIVSINGAAVTQASSAIPGIGMYISVLHRALRGELRSTARQAVDLWDQLTGIAPLDVDEEGRIRLDRWELSPGVQEAVERNWSALDTDNYVDLADVDWFRDSVYRLYGFCVDGIDYAQPSETDVAWPELPT